MMYHCVHIGSVLHEQLDNVSVSVASGNQQRNLVHHTTGRGLCVYVCVITGGWPYSLCSQIGTFCIVLILA